MISYKELIDYYEKHGDYPEIAYEIVKRIPYTREKNRTFFNKITGFVNNYIIEEKFHEISHLKYIEKDSHMSLHPGKGTSSADFLNTDGRTIELKSSETKPSANGIQNYCWHRANIKVVYIMDEGNFYEMVGEHGDYDFRFLFHAPLKLIPKRYYKPEPLF